MNISKNWQYWCRLCASTEEQTINIFLADENMNTGHLKRKQLELSIAIGKYFRVEIKEDEKLPIGVCTTCFLLITYVLNFDERVKQVQQMYDEMKTIGKSTDVETTSLRVKYGILEDYSPHEVIQSSITDYKLMNCIKEIYEDVAPAIKNLRNENLTDEEDGTECEDPLSSKCDENRAYKNYIKTSEKKNTQHITLKPKDRTRKSEVKDLTKTTEFKCHCTECTSRFRRVGSYSLHMNKKHGILGDLPTFSCTTCCRSFKSLGLLNRHLKTHRPLSEKEIFPCPQCDRKFQTNYYVATHIKVAHEGARPFICEECGKALGTKLALNEHMLTHTDYAPFECEICKRTFKSQRRLKNHLDIHSSDNHTCGICGLQLSSRTTLNRHKLVHSDEMNHKCDYCGRAFKRAISLKDHLLLHSGLRPYLCDFCDRTFSNSSNCRIHMKRLHSKEYVEQMATCTKSRVTNVPKLAVLKSVIKTAKNLVPVASKKSGNFAERKRSTRQLKEDAVPSCNGPAVG